MTELAVIQQQLQYIQAFMKAMAISIGVVSATTLPLGIYIWKSKEKNDHDRDESLTFEISSIKTMFDGWLKRLENKVDSYHTELKQADKEFANEIYERMKEDRLFRQDSFLRLGNKIDDLQKTASKNDGWIERHEATLKDKIQ